MSFGARLDGSKVVLGGLDANRETLGNIKNLLITGCGTSKYAG